MIKKHKIRCDICDTLASPLCECQRVAVVSKEDDREFLAVYTDDLSKCTLLKIWEDYDGKIHKVARLRDITEAKVSNL